MLCVRTGRLKLSLSRDCNIFLTVHDVFKLRKNQHGLSSECETLVLSRMLQAYSEIFDLIKVFDLPNIAEVHKTLERLGQKAGQS